jgi:hypothetical protein
MDSGRWNRAKKTSDEDELTDRQPPLLRRRQAQLYLSRYHQGSGILLCRIFLSLSSPKDFLGRSETTVFRHNTPAGRGRVAPHEGGISHSTSEAINGM